MKIWGRMADNLIEAYISENPKRLRFEIKRVKNVEFERGELEAPFSQETLEEAKKRAINFRVAQPNKMKEI